MCPLSKVKTAKSCQLFKRRFSMSLQMTNILMILIKIQRKRQVQRGKLSTLELMMKALTMMRTMITAKSTRTMITTKSTTTSRNKNSSKTRQEQTLLLPRLKSQKSKPLPRNKRTTQMMMSLKSHLEPRMRSKSQKSQLLQLMIKRNHLKSTQMKIGIEFYNKKIKHNISTNIIYIIF